MMGNVGITHTDIDNYDIYTHDCIVFSLLLLVLMLSKICLC